MLNGERGNINCLESIIELVSAEANPSRRSSSLLLLLTEEWRRRERRRSSLKLAITSGCLRKQIVHRRNQWSHKTYWLRTATKCFHFESWRDIAILEQSFTLSSSTAKRASARKSARLTVVVVHSRNSTIMECKRSQFSGVADKLCIHDRSWHNESDLYSQMKKKRSDDSSVSEWKVHSFIEWKNISHWLNVYLRTVYVFVFLSSRHVQSFN